MRRQLPVLAMIALLGPPLLAAAQVPQQEAEETCTIDGYVVRIGSGEPLRKAQVVLRPERDGYVDQEYGQVSPNRPGTVLVLAPGQEVTDVIISLVPTGTIAGRVFDEDGDLLVRATVRALRYVYQDGEKTLTQVDQAMTNDLGEYRVYWLDPGEYLVSATYEARFGGVVQGLVRGGGRGRGGRGTEGGGGGGRGRTLPAETPAEETYVDTYYPGTSDPTLASSIVVPAGAEVLAIDFNVLPTRAVTLRGRVVSPSIGEGGPTPIVTVVPRNTVVAGNRVNFRGGGGRGGRCGQNQDGSFELTGIAPGSYTLVAILRTQQGRDGRGGQGQLVGTADIEVGEDDLDGLLVTVNPGVALQGRVLVDQGASDVDPTRLRVRLQPGNNLPFNAPNTAVGDDGTFVMENVSQASYRATVTGLPRDAYLAEVRYGGSDVLSDGLQVMGEPPGPLEFLVSGAGGVVEGSVRIEQNRVLTGAQVVLIPAAQRDRRDLYKTASVDQYGRFTIQGIAPGAYKVFAWEDAPSGAYLDPGFVRAYEEDGDIGRHRTGRQCSGAGLLDPGRPVRPILNPCRTRPIRLMHLYTFPRSRAAVVCGQTTTERSPSGMKKTVLLMSVILITAACVAQSNMNETDSGLKYIDHQVGDGDEAIAGKTVEVHYTGWLYVDGERGAKFDSSVDRGQPFSFQLGASQVIRGWDEGVQGMKVGGKRELIIPPDLGYGSRGAGGAIPPNATLDFEVELLRVSP